MGHDKKPMENKQKYTLFNVKKSHLEVMSLLEYFMLVTISSYYFTFPY